eukprot:1928682-Amphidinium_carterae.2
MERLDSSQKLVTSCPYIATIHSPFRGVQKLPTKYERSKEASKHPPYVKSVLRNGRNCCVKLFAVAKTDLESCRHACVVEKEIGFVCKLGFR